MLVLKGDQREGERATRENEREGEMGGGGRVVSPSRTVCSLKVRRRRRREVCIERREVCLRTFKNSVYVFLALCFRWWVSRRVACRSLKHRG